VAFRPAQTPPPIRSTQTNHTSPWPSDLHRHHLQLDQHKPIMHANFGTTLTTSAHISRYFKR